ncbi:MAG: thioredoxin [Candidatus Moranbacteria bacterium]|nr:thioredoxin [Candidatus Moranbacteria bacterium]
MQELKDSNFEQQVKDHQGVVLVDFFAPWCGPCQMMAPIIDEVAEKFQGKIKIMKMNTDQNPNTAQEYQIASIPTLIFFKNGKEDERLIGAYDRESLINKIEEKI